MNEFFRNLELTNQSMCFFLGHFSPEHNIPKFRRNPKSKFLTSKMMLIMILLKPMKIRSPRFRCINMMQRIMYQIVDKVPNNKPKPESKINMRVRKIDNFIHTKIPNSKRNNRKRRWKNNPIPIIK